MKIFYNKLWDKLKQEKINKGVLAESLNISSATIAKMGKNKVVSLDTLIKICIFLECDIGDIVSIKEQ